MLVTKAYATSSASLLALYLAVCLLPLTLSAQSIEGLSGAQQSQLPSEAYDLKQIVGIAVFEYKKPYADFEQIMFTITEDSEISEILRAFTFETQDGRDIGTVPNAYVYLKDSAGKIEKAKVVIAWQYIMLGDRWEKLYRLSEAGSKIIQREMLRPKKRTRP